MARRVDDAPGRLTSEMGVLAFKQGFNRWSGNDRADDGGIARYTLSALAGLWEAAAALG